MTLPTAKFPNIIEADLRVLKDLVPGAFSPTLAAAMDNVQTSFTLSTGQGAALPDENFLVLIGQEKIFIGSRIDDLCSSILRGVGAVAHSVNTPVEAFIFAEHHNQIAAEILEMQVQMRILMGI